MSKQSTQDDKNFLNMAGEFAVASELNRRQILASVTYGNAKAADVFALGDAGTYVRIEVKTTSARKWLVGKKATRPEEAKGVLWVLVYMPEPGNAPQFFILTPQELYDIWHADATKYESAFLAKHGHNFEEVGVPNVRQDDVLTFEGAWDKIVNCLRLPVVS